MSSPETAIVVDIQRFSIHDGPGIRTVVFFKGCGMSCVWCQNPETVRAKPELAYYENRCLDGCRECAGSCPEDAIFDRRTDRVDFSRCTVCGDCVDVCPADALVRVGREMSVDELLHEVEKDRSFFEASGGGLTLSGGEPVLHSTFLRRFLPTVQRSGFHIALETAGAYPFGQLQPLLPIIDLVLFDLKIMEPELHQQYTERDNAQIHDNLRRLVRDAAPVAVRMPIVPGKNTDDLNVKATAELLDQLGITQLTLLPYNHLWEAKLPRLATQRQPLGIQPPSPELCAELQSTFARFGVDARV